MHTQRTIGLILIGCLLAALAALAGLVLWFGSIRGFIVGVAMAASLGRESR